MTAADIATLALILLVLGVSIYVLACLTASVFRILDPDYFDRHEPPEQR